MVKRFRMVAGPNGSGKSSLVRRLREEYAVNFYDTYLYYVATEAVQINLGRIANRRMQGGHDVPADKVVSRYKRSLAQVKEAIPYLSRAYFFDNSGSSMAYLGQYSDEKGYAFGIPVERLPN